jgi:hypothetical protein
VVRENGRPAVIACSFCCIVGMPEIIYYVAASLDGYIATRDGDVEWLAPFEATGEDYGYATFMPRSTRCWSGARRTSKV